MRIADVVEQLVRTANREIVLEQESVRLRPYEENIIWGDNGKLVEATGWAPTVSLQQTVSDTLEFWRQRALDRRATPA